MQVDLTDKNLIEVANYLKSKGYIPTSDDFLCCSSEDCDYAGYDQTNECYIHEKYSIATYKCDCGRIFYEILAKDDDLPYEWKMKDGIMVGLE